ncbi:MAG: alpha/beta hydrolase [Holosporales bacterium]|jgi:alpha/beta superfamily hydrolase|nr:alpha/beta hydrolase [Holosporales bacterium]
MVDIFINGPDGRLEARYLPPSNSALPVVTILHPHPLKGGRMDNDVVQCMSKAFHEQGFGTLRFNFRGVGRSEGVFGDGEGELNDAAAALDWLQSSQYLTNSLWVAGFSFGAWIAMQLLMRRPEFERFVIVNPQIDTFDFNFLAPCPVSGQIIYGEQDKTVSQAAVENLVAKIRAQRGLNICYDTISGANHSFDGLLDKLNKCIQEYVKRELATMEKEREQIAS